MLQTILRTVNSLYEQTFDGIRLHREMIGYVCIVSDGFDQYVVKVFRCEHTQQALQSAEITSYLDEQGIPTPRIIPTSEGKPYFIYADNGTQRIGILYEYIDGTEPCKTECMEALGIQTGMMHSIMKKYRGKLLELDRAHFIDRYITILNGMNYPRVNDFADFGNTLWERVDGLPRGFSHGDYHPGNMILTKQGTCVILDFDAAGYAFPLYDIAVLCDGTDYFIFDDNSFDSTKRLVERFLHEYLNYWSLDTEEIRAIYDFIAIRHYEVQATVFESLGTKEADARFIDSQFEWLMKWDNLCKTRL